MALLNALFLIRFLGLGTVTSKDSPFQVKCANSLPGHIQTALWPPPAMQATKMLAVINDHIKRLGISGDVHAVIPLGQMAFPADLHGDHAEDGLLRSHLDTQDGAPYLGRAREILIGMAVVLAPVAVNKGVCLMQNGLPNI